MKKFDYSIDPVTGIHRAPLWRIAGYALNDTATILYLYLMSYVSYYLVGFVGVVTIVASSFTAIMRVWDGVTDPIIGFIIDKTETKFGKNRPFMVLGNLILCATSYILFHVTHLLPQGIRLLFFIVIALLYYIGYTFQGVVTKSAQTCMTNDPKQRPRYGMFLNIFNVLFVLVFMVYSSNIVVPKYGTMYETGLFHELWVFVAILSGILTLIAAISIAPKDRKEYYGTGEPQKIQIKDYLDVIKNNKAIQMLIISASTDKLAQAAKTSAATIVMYGVVVGNYALNGGFTVYSYVAGMIFAVIGLGFLTPKIGLKKAMIIGSWGGIVLNSLLCLLWIFGDPRTLSLPGYVNGYGQEFSGITLFTAVLFLLTILTTFFTALSGNTVYPMTADCADYEIYRSGKYVPGMIGTLFSLVDKLVSSLAPLLAGLLFAAIGFAEKLPDVSTPETLPLRLVGIFLTYGILIIGNIFNVIAMKHYPLTKEKMVEIQEKIAQIKQAHAQSTGE
ncbi:MAG: MFS transporter [Lachnospiraceae bacterium]|nr:MFS transporter [Lachnospiraceae bacterium]